MLRVFICYGGDEGERIGLHLRSYLRENGVEAFLASPRSPDITVGTTNFNRFIDDTLLSSNLLVPVCDSGIHRSQPAQHELQLAKQKGIPIVAFIKKRCVLPTLIKKDWQPIRFDPLNPKDTFPTLLIAIYKKVDYERELSEDLSPKRPVELFLPKQLTRLFRKA